jgi:hypothetical protein
MVRTGLGVIRDAQAIRCEGAALAFLALYVKL